MHAGHVFLQAGQIIQAWWFPILSLTLDFGDGHAHARHVHDVEQMPCPGLLVDALAGQMPAAHVEDDFPERSGPVALNLPVTSDDHAKGRRLDPADSQAPAVDERVSAAGVHADEPVGLGTKFGGCAESVVCGFRFHLAQGLSDGGFFQAGDPQTHGRLVHAGMVTEVLDNATEDRLAFPIRVTCVDERGHVISLDELLDGLELPVGAFLPVDDKFSSQVTGQGAAYPSASAPNRGPGTGPG